MIAMVTGGARGLGACIVKALASKKIDVIINYNKSNDDATRLKEELESKYNINVYLYKCDVSKEEEVKGMFSSIEENIGNIDILINNAAYAMDDNYMDKTGVEFLRVLEVNVVGTFLVSKYASNIMDNGIIINISSTDSTKTFNEISMDYCASKAGVNSLCKTFSMALKNIKVIGVLLPWINTDSTLEMDKNYLDSELKRTRQEKLLDKYDVASKIVELITDTNIVTGSIIELDSDLKWI